MSAQQGLIPTLQTYANTTNCYYLKADNPVVSDLTGNPGILVNTVSTSSAPAGLVVRATNEEGISYLGVRNPDQDQEYRIINSDYSGEGYSAKDLDIWSYPAGIGAKRILNAGALGNAIVLGDSTTAGGCLVQVNGTEGEGQIFDSLYNRPPPVQFIFGNQSFNLGASGSITVDTDNVITNVSLDDSSGTGTLFLDNPGQTALGDTYGIRFTASPGMTVRICSPSGLPLGNLVNGISSAFTPVVNTVYWFACTATDTFTYIGKMEASVP